MLLQSKVSFFHSLKNTNESVSAKLLTIINAIRDGEWKDKIDAVRSAKTKTEKDRLKKQLPGFTPSGTFKSRNDRSLTEHSNVILLDIDKVENLEDLRKEIRLDDHTAALFTSCSGNGLAVVVPIDGAKHAESFEALESYYKQKFSINLDSSCRNLSRFRFVSYDPDAYINEKASTFIVTSTNPEIKAPKAERKVSDQAVPVTDEAATDPVNLTGWTDKQKYDWVVAQNNKKKSYSAGGHHEFLLALCGLLNKAGVSQTFAETQVVADFEVKTKNKDAILSIIRHCYRFTEDFGTFIIFKEQRQLQEETNKEGLNAVYAEVNKMNRKGQKWADYDVHLLSQDHRVPRALVQNIFEYIDKVAADEHGMDKWPKIKIVEFTLNKEFDFQMDEITRSAEYRVKGEKDFQPMDMNSVNRYLQHQGINFALNQLKSLLESDFVTRHNPIKEYFEQLPVWDRTTDHIYKLAGYVQTTDQEFFKVQFKKMLVRSIECTLGGRVNRMIFTLVSEAQEVGKSTFIRSLNPFGDQYYTEAPLSSGKDSTIRLAENFIYNLEELSSLRNVEVNHLKAVISTALVKERKPYDRNETLVPRRCNFFGSTNKEEFLTDVVNTRWLCFTVESIDWAYTKDVDINQVWAQAYTLYKDGYDAQLTREEKNHRDDINRGYEVHSTETDLILRHFHPVPKNAVGAVWMSTTDIQEYLIKHSESQLKLHPTGIGRAMAQLQFHRDRKSINGHQHRGFWVGITARNTETQVNQSTADLFKDIEL